MSLLWRTFGASVTFSEWGAKRAFCGLLLPHTKQTGNIEGKRRGKSVKKTGLIFRHIYNLGLGFGGIQRGELSQNVIESGYIFEGLLTVRSSFLFTVGSGFFSKVGTGSTFTTSLTLIINYYDRIYINLYIYFSFCFLND